MTFDLFPFVCAEGNTLKDLSMAMLEPYAGVHFFPVRDPNPFRDTMRALFPDRLCDALGFCVDTPLDKPEAVACIVQHYGVEAAVDKESRTHMVSCLYTPRYSGDILMTDAIGTRRLFMPRDVCQMGQAGFWSSPTHWVAPHGIRAITLEGFEDRLMTKAEVFRFLETDPRR